MSKPISLRRLRMNPWMRNLVQETRVQPLQLIQPLFVSEGLSEREPIRGLKDIFRETPETLLQLVEADLKKGVRTFLLFGLPQKLSEDRSGEVQAAFTQSQVASLKRRFGNDLCLWVDVCLCAHVPQGHCGFLEHGQVQNAATVQTLSEMALVYAQAGADAVAPSDMMDGRIGAIRNQLDTNGWDQTVLVSYAAKFHSHFYGPFRGASRAYPQGLKDRSTYQIDPARGKDAFLSASRDAEEGADILMVKPGMPYLDVLKELSAKIHKPWAVYQVSGEYAALESLIEQNFATAGALYRETWTGFVRAGASMIISYAARRAFEYFESYEGKGGNGG